MIESIYKIYCKHTVRFKSETAYEINQQMQLVIASVCIDIQEF